MKKILLLCFIILNIFSYSKTREINMDEIDAVTSASIVPAKYVNKYVPKGFTNSDKKKALFVVGDMRKNSITFDMLYTAVKFFEDNNMEAEIRDLYEMNWNPVLSMDEFYYQKDGIGVPKEDVAREQDFVRKADYIIFVYPNWHDTPNVMVKGYQERVFAKKFAYEDGQNGGINGLLKGKGIFTIMNCGWLGGGRGFINGGVGIDDKKWNSYMKAFKVLDDDTAEFWGAENCGRFVTDLYPRNNDKEYKEHLERLRADLRNYLKDVFINGKRPKKSFF